jgi:ABC-type polysaccharide/polyol phosphate transport system ATPase subunit
VTTTSSSITAAAPSGGAALEVINVTKSFRVHRERANSLKQRLAGGGRNRYEEFLALKDVSFTVNEGEVFGVIGHNGSGKSTLLKCMAGILRPNTGEVHVHKRMSALLELGAGFHPELSGRDNVFLNAAILGMTRREIAKRFDEIVDFSGLAEFIDTPVKTYSSGMYVRLAFAVAINVDPSLLLIDEILAVGDVTFQQRCMEKFAQFRDEGRTIVIVTHDLTTVKNMCDRAVLLEHGVLTGEGDPAVLVDQYTEGMLGTGIENPDGTSRRGSGEIVIERAELLVDGEASTRCRTGDSVVLRLHYDAGTTVQNPVFALRVESLTGVMVTFPCTRDVELVPPTLVGRGTVEIELRDLPLLPGPYVIHTEITGYGRQHVFDHLHQAVRFDVMTGDSHETGGFVTLRPNWTINQSAPDR